MLEHTPGGSRVGRGCKAGGTVIPDGGMGVMATLLTAVTSIYLSFLVSSIGAIGDTSISAATQCCWPGLLLSCGHYITFADNSKNIIALYRCLWYYNIIYCYMVAPPQPPKVNSWLTLCILSFLFTLPWLNGAAKPKHPITK